MDTSIFVFGGILVAITATYLFLHKTQRERLVYGLKTRGRKVSSAGTPPRDLAPEKQPSGPLYGDVLPPLRREALYDVARTGISVKDVLAPKDLGDSDVVRSILPLTANYRTCTEVKFTPPGFSTDEIRALGNFPDYATLSGIPLPSVYEEFDIDKALPRPYRPFRWNYHQTMSLTKMEPDWWLELENTYKSRVAHRKILHAKHGKSVLDKLPGSELACKELMEMVIQFLCARYPRYFSLSEDKRYFTNGILDTVEDLHTKDPLVFLMDNVPEDFGIMLRDDKTGNYVLRAGSICSSLGWNLTTKMGMQLHEIHEPIPDYKEKMQFSMDRYFAKMPTDKPIQRGSWGLEVEQPLFMPPGDPHELHRLSQSDSLQLSSCYLRVDWQTLRRLPLSGSIIFNFKALFTPVTEFRDEPGIPALVAKILREGKRNIMEYKNTWHVEHVVLPALDQWAKEQEEKGIIEKDWNVTTLEDSPYFKGWEEKWHRQQGF
ncbi:uncharacterized protein CIMG_06702 [Coccidioides immitis RS]|uniref:HRQ family protein n=3 Tax=Coccidioides immitis TaxID=5501 RepID=J3K8Q2_COCIM|nr:uncharacterized protein CIMG_06702 [Coccidioides immitis RS]EAS31223.3 hypothetical protein CIMG_06702 [Coccidioides immitis RS]KMP03840.1 hypothetical protein CIRG_03532 [Coccidioides immitis RMSCC 2394]KMU83354.1 hypothetical protein CIHG_01136 [Coccidioides immitis H538.4]TPX24063.1 hypothetical protein DIZ76_013406 [Coccidioides immitis]